MACGCNGMALIYTVMDSPSPVLAGGTIPGGTIVRRYGAATQSGNGVVVYETGYYNVDVNVVYTPVTTGVNTISLYDNGVEIPGALATVYGTANIPQQVTLHAMIRVIRCGEPHTITTVSAAAATIGLETVRVEKVKVYA